MANKFFKRIRLSPDDVSGAVLPLSDVEKNSVADLKLFLLARGVKLTSFKKEYLVQIAKRLSPTTPVSSTANQCRPLSVKAAEDRVERHEILKAACIFPMNGWKQFPSTLIPKLTQELIHEYLVNAVVIDSSGEEDDLDIGTAKSFRRGLTYVTSNHVVDIMDLVKDSHYFAKCYVLASMKDQRYHVVVKLCATVGTIVDASCQCKAAALQRCSHVAALLLKLHDHASRFGHDPVPCTSRTCSWNRGGNHRDPAPIYQQQYSNKRDPQRALTFNPRRIPPESRSTKDETLALCLNPSLFPSSCRWIDQLDFDYHDYALTEDRKKVLMDLRRELQIALLFEHLEAPGEVPATRNQCGSPEWLRYRLLLITASVIKNFLSVSPDNVYRKLREHLWYPMAFKSKYTQYGKAHEPEARKAYQLLSNNVTINETGMWVNPKYPGLAASPDGIVLCHQTNTMGTKVHSSSTSSLNP